MKSAVIAPSRLTVILIVAAGLCLFIALTGNSTTQAQADAGSAQQAVPHVTCPDEQCFADILPANPFYANINALYMDGIISGYACGGLGEPCDQFQRPYYRPANNVSRQQMTKFVDLGRRNIAAAVGSQLVMTSTSEPTLRITTSANDSIRIDNSSGSEAIEAKCIQAGQNCYAVYGTAQSGDYAGYFSGGKGVTVSSNDSGFSAVNASSSGASIDSYAVRGVSTFRAGYFKSNTVGAYSVVIEAADPTQTTAALDIEGTLRVTGNLIVVGSKQGYVVDIMQNLDSSPLEAGDIVTIVGNSEAVVGQIPVVTVRKSNSAYDTGVVGIVDQVMYVPDAATEATYKKEQADRKAAQEQRDALLASAAGQPEGSAKPDTNSIKLPALTITDEQGTVHATNKTQAQTGDYASVVTLGSYKMIKVDASFGPIKPGDLLTTSTNPGYAMKATDRTLAPGATIGKALGSLDNGTGTIPVMVTLK